ncbi:hypothetical protein EG68_12465 [Paragonimus skrjabini miyazakii]|uniref:Uncharacterized protein n=1 Tax=Paragonimus skrjabini miyazakii TaxID=59628 RepID=A0A8S9YHX4_9TREM|nr:hypothetical protein EG68_12465 [Paragonimus skrjabini miyazakii]
MPLEAVIILAGYVHDNFSSFSKSPTNFMSPPMVNIDADRDLKDFMSATCNALVRIREEIHGLRLDINALRYQISTPLSRESTGYPVKFPMDTVEDLQLLNTKLEDITLRNTLVNYRFVHFIYTDELFETHRRELCWDKHPQYPGNTYDR